MLASPGPGHSEDIGGVIGRDRPGPGREQDMKVVGEYIYFGATRGWVGRMRMSNPRTSSYSGLSGLEEACDLVFDELIKVC